MRNDVAVPGYGAQWQAEIEAVMAHGVPFVLIYLEPGDDEAHANRKAAQPVVEDAQGGLWPFVYQLDQRACR
ncbi:hypothetical protein K2E96_19945 [Pseudomonas sp. ERGC3:05]|nr:hypothetical protein [Pseudomonas sp. ERGC3:01]QZC93240.1 hypothetical protein K2E96_19945 [Pseudomonas sp. ERGC3:05]